MIRSSRASNRALRVGPVLLALIGSSCVPQNRESGTELKPFVDPRKPPIHVTLSADPEQQRDSVCVEVCVKNISDRPIGWDPEFAVGLILNAWTDEKLPPDDGLPGNDRLQRSRLKRVDMGYVMDALRTKERFVRIQPGGSLRKKVIINKSIRHLGLAPIPFGEGSMAGGGEELYRFEIPDSCKEVTVAASYFVFIEFLHYFGFHSEEVDVPGTDWLNFNEVKIKLVDARK